MASKCLNKTSMIATGFALSPHVRAQEDAPVDPWADGVDRRVEQCTY